MAITFQEIEKVDNGAHFFDADLHVHSFGGSHDVKDATMTPEAIIDEAVRLGIRVLAITDHNNDMNTEKSVTHAQKYTGTLLVLPGVEITTANGHLLVYFAPAEAENVGKLLAKIDLVGKPGDKDSHTAKSMADVIKEAERLGGISIAAHIDRTKTGFEMLAAGYPNWKRDILISPGLYGLEIDAVANLTWYSDSDSSADGAERKKLLAARRNVPALKGRPDLAHIQGSDSHSLADLQKGRVGKILTRFKLNELSFDSVRTALTDCEARTRAVATIPKALPRILGMQITGGFLDGETYHFSDNLNCFIGGRGTGKSSALQSLAYGLGLADDLEEHDNCPGTVVVYCEDENGIRYRYERIQGSEPTVKAREGPGAVVDVPRDVFRVEYYPQGELSEVAKNPLKNPALFQDFLDRHLPLGDLFAEEEQLVLSLEQNSAQLIPLEANNSQLPKKTQALKDVETKLKIAEEGKVKEIAEEQTKLANEKNLATSIAQIRDDYKSGVSLSEFLRDYAEYESMNDPLTGTPASKTALAKVKAAVDGVNKELANKEKEIKRILDDAAREISAALLELKNSQQQLETKLSGKKTELQKKGLQGDVAEFNRHLAQKAVLVQEISKIKTQATLLNRLRKERQKHLEELTDVREQISQRRKDQLKSINENLLATIDDYTVFVHYEPSGIIDNFRDFVLEKMHGSRFQDQMADQLCSKITPCKLAELVLNEDAQEISKLAGIHEAWAGEICAKLRFFETLHRLEIMWKPPSPVITAKTKTARPKEIPVNQLSDGQKHTIMLTIAMLAESNIPLIIDQPEDDLDNAFIFSAVVKALRTIKERRQVILVTHNANIAVLGDAELLLPMRRNGDGGGTFDAGSIDKSDTKKAVLSILEGGDIAFRRRKEVYGH